MTQSLSIAYISLTGNTHSFVTKLIEYFKFQQSSLQIQLINVKDIIRDHIEFFELEHPTIAFLPTYLEGGNGVDNGDTEILKKRISVINSEDTSKTLRKSHENPYIKRLYEAYFDKPMSHNAHELLHTRYFEKSKI